MESKQFRGKPSAILCQQLLNVEDDFTTIYTGKQVPDKSDGDPVCKFTWIYIFKMMQGWIRSGFRQESPRISKI